MNLRIGKSENSKSQKRQKKSKKGKNPRNLSLFLRRQICIVFAAKHYELGKPKEKEQNFAHIAISQQ